MKKPIFLCSLLIAICSLSFAQTPNPASDFTYTETAAAVTITGYNKTGGAVVIPERINNKPVTTIGQQAFYEKQLTAVTIPDSVRTIGNYAFANNQLTSVTIPNGVTTIGSYAFRFNKLTSVTIPPGVTSLESGVFYGNQLTSVTIPSSVTTIGSYAFRFNKLTSVTIPPGVTSIGAGAFEGNQLTGVTVPSSVTTIENHAFQHCPLTSITLGAYVTLGGWLIDNCDAHLRDAYNDTGRRGGTYTRPAVGSTAWAAASLAPVTAPAGGDYRYTETASAVTITGYTGTAANVVIPERINNKPVTAIGYRAFLNKMLTGVTIPNTVTSIEMEAFNYNRLTSVTIPPGVKSIGHRAFMNNQLARITIGANVELGEYITMDLVNTIKDVYNSGGRQAGTYMPRVPGSAFWFKVNLPLAPAAGVSVVYQDVDHAVNGVTYDRSGTGINPYTFPPGVMTLVNTDGTISVCALDNGFTYVYEYTADLRLTKTMRFPCELEGVGAFTKDGEGNYYIFYFMDVQKEDEAAWNTENMALVKYNSSGVKTNTFRLKADPNRNANTAFSGVKRPLEASSCRLEVSGNMIAVYFGRQQFRAPDGLNHQASYGFVLNKDSFARLDRNMPLVSHSFNQWILPVEGGFVFADQGDGGPRTFAFAKWQNGAVSGKAQAFTFKGGGPGAAMPNGYPGHLPGDIQYNYTFAQMGGVVKTQNSSGRDDGYIFVGTYENKTRPAPTAHNESRNLFIVTIDEAVSTVSEPVYITNYTNKDTHNAISPKIAALGNNRFLLMWEQLNSVNAYSAVIDRTGRLLSPVKELPGIVLSYNDVLRYNPTNGRVYWAIRDPHNYARIAIYSYAP